MFSFIHSFYLLKNLADSNKICYQVMLTSFAQIQGVSLG